MSRKTTPKSREATVADTTDASDSKALTVNVPVEVLHRAKTRASLEGATMSAVVSDALSTYAEGLRDVLARLGLGAHK
jgi:hypothetical protein